MAETTEIIVDGLAVDVDAEEYERDPNGVIWSVKEARRALRLEEVDGEFTDFRDEEDSGEVESDEEPEDDGDPGDPDEEAEV